MFTLAPGTAAKLVHVNMRAELHGTETVPQADLRFEVALPNTILDAFDPELRPALYRAASPAHPAAKLPELPGVEPVSDTPELRFPALSMPLKWDEEGTGYFVAVETGLPGPALMLSGVKVGGLRLDCLDGGTVGVDFRVQTTASPDVETLAELARFIQRMVRVTVALPTIPEGQDDWDFAVPDEAPV